MSTIAFIGRPQAPGTAHHLLGTDVLGHDLLSQLLAAIHQTMLSALTCAAAAVVGGTIAGAVAGYYGGWLDSILTWLTTVVVAIPALAVLLIVAIWSRFPVSPLGYGLWIAAILWTAVARVVRASFISARVKEYVEAAHALGASDARVITRHLLPNVLGPVIVSATTLIGQAVILLATISYLGYAPEPYNTPTLGTLLADAARGTGAAPGSNFALSAPWWLYVFPALLLVLFLVSVNFVGDALDDALEPRI